MTRAIGKTINSWVWRWRILCRTRLRSMLVMLRYWEVLRVYSRPRLEHGKHSFTWTNDSEILFVLTQKHIEINKFWFSKMVQYSVFESNKITNQKMKKFVPTGWPLIFPMKSPDFSRISRPQIKTSILNCQHTTTFPWQLLPCCHISWHFLYREIF